MPDKDSILSKMMDSIQFLNKNFLNLTDSISKVKEYTDYQLAEHTEKVSLFSNLFTWAPFIPILIWIIIVWIDFYKKKKSISELWNVHTINFSWVFLWLLSGVSFCYALYQSGKIHVPKNGFTVSHLDLILAVASLIAIVGAVWAVYARIDAERAFKKSEDTFKKSQETLEAIGNSSFPFVDIFNSDKFPAFFDIPSNVVTPRVLDKTTLSMYLGFPCIGYLFEKNGDFKSTPEEILFIINEYLYQLKTRLAQNKVEKSQAAKLRSVKLNICVFSKKKVLTILNGKILSYGSTTNLIDVFYDQLDDLQKMSKKDSNDNPIVDDYDNLIVIKCGKEKSDAGGNWTEENFSPNEKLRFISFYNPASKVAPSKAYVWVVPRIVTNNGTITSFDSSAFQTTDTKFIDVLESVFGIS
jgi:hypothetical protein